MIRKTVGMMIPAVIAAALTAGLTACGPGAESDALGQARGGDVGSSRATTEERGALAGTSDHDGRIADEDRRREAADAGEGGPISGARRGGDRSGHETDRREETEGHAEAGVHRHQDAARSDPGSDGHAEGEGHHHEEGSDLDRGADELFAAECEHAVYAYQCEDCRYEVGVVKVPVDLIERGLIDTARVERGSFGTGLELTGEIRFDERKIAHLSPRLPGIIRRVFVDLGQSVSGGAPLVGLDSPELAEAQADYLTALAEHKLARRNYERQSELREAKISSEREFLEADRSLETARIGSNSGRQRLLRLGITEGEIAELESEGIAGATGLYLLKAPFAGEVLDLHAVRGEQVDLDRELALFGSTETLWVWVDLYESYLDAVSSAKVESGIEAKVSVQAYPGETFEGKLDFIGSTMSEDTRTVKARVTLENADGRLKPGMFATVILLLGDHREAPAVPSSAVLSDEGREFVFVHRLEDYFLRREVRTGRTIGGFVEILAGLSPGQTITARGSFLLKSDVLRSKMGEGCAH